MSLRPRIIEDVSFFETVESPQVKRITAAKQDVQKAASILNAKGGAIAAAAPAAGKEAVAAELKKIGDAPRGNQTSRCRGGSRRRRGRDADGPWRRRRS